MLGGEGSNSMSSFNDTTIYSSKYTISGASRRCWIFKYVSHLEHSGFRYEAVLLAGPGRVDEGWPGGGKNPSCQM